MNNKLRITITAIVLANILSFNSVAYAGIFDWFSNSSAQTHNSSLSFDSIYSGIFNIDTQANQSDNIKTSPLAFQGQSISQASNPNQNKTAPKSSQVYVVFASAYSSTPDQTDSTPFITASGTHVRDGVIATNFLPIGTVIRIPELYGDKLFIVEDRMNRRYWQKIDIWFPERNMALEFGVQKVTIEIVS